MIRNLFCVIAVAATAGAALNVAAQNFPSRPIRVIVAQASGGAGDVQARLTSAALSERLGVPLVIENKPGGAFIIGTEFVVRAAPDGYTLLHSTLQGLNIFPSPDKLPYDPERDLVPISMAAATDAGFAATSKLGVRNLKEFVALAKSLPGKLTFGSSGPGSSTHFAGELLRLRTGIDILHVPFKGGVASLNETLAGRIDLAITGSMHMLTHSKSGLLVPLAATSRKRSTVLPDLPTMLELGYPDVVIYFWYGLFAPAGTPQPIIAKLAMEIAGAAGSPKFAEQVNKIGHEVRIEGPEEFARTIASDRRLWRGVAKDANIRFE